MAEIDSLTDELAEIYRQKQEVRPCCLAACFMDAPYTGGADQPGHV